MSYPSEKKKYKHAIKIVTEGMRIWTQQTKLQKS